MRLDEMCIRDRNIIPIPFILLLITKIFNKLKQTRTFKPMVEKLENKALGKKDQIEKYEFWGLVLFVGIPLPGTGAWTGALIASLPVSYTHLQDVIVIIDEAYIDFGGVSALPLIEKYDNVLIVQTFSKSRSMAGMRVGYAMGNKTLIKYLNDVKYSFNSYTMNQTVLAAAPAAIEDEAYFQGTRKKIMETRERVKTELRAVSYTHLLSGRK